METNRCNIIKLQNNDYHDVKLIYMNEKVRTYLGGIIPEEHTLNKFLDTLERSRTGSYYWVVRLKSNNDCIGLVSLDKHMDGQHFEISYEFLPNWWGQGYAKEVITRMLDYIFNELHLTKVIAETQTANHSSCKLLENVGMKLEQTVTRYGAEQAIYGMEKQSWDTRAI
ncbi:GNAT family N-acetyltransferase [Paenibacillus barcinonensis]|uniref:GNAT family N-acetyltransferase n=1 Tax=Paenibacillus barcinonensis TaxID=198119 RepID=UPI001C0FD72F|nr:GNAT family N-acetyltransferase [Paenibacillus barcinonensis]MBU5354702.1 GNAT family N-acetyltransferase [Paenibacillus barcinonensis]